jgi:hypothetical protein
MTSQRIGKYACLETERRYLLNKVPDGLLDNPKGWLITDRYFPNTRLRLRHMKSVSGNENIYKLTQKYRSETQNASETTITNIYSPKQNIITGSFRGKDSQEKALPVYTAKLLVEY